MHVVDESGMHDPYKIPTRPLTTVLTAVVPCSDVGTYGTSRSWHFSKMGFVWTIIDVVVEKPNMTQHTGAVRNEAGFQVR